MNCSGFRAARSFPAAVVVAATACTEPVTPSNALGETPRILAMRIEVTEAGRYVDDLLPIPADRVRSDALPDDEIEVSLLVANEDGELDAEALDGSWYLCRADDSCTESLAGETRPSPCESLPHGAEGCFAGRGPRLRLRVPELIPELTVTEQSRFRILYVAPLVSGITPQQCINDVVAREETLTDCLFGLRRARLGPLGPLADAANEAGVTFDETWPQLVLDDPLAYIPDFNPEIRHLVLDGEGALSPGLMWPGDTRLLRSDEWVTIRIPRDYTDYQPLVFFDGELPVTAAESVTTRFYFTEALEGRGQTEIALRPEAGKDFEMFSVVVDGRGSQGWASFHFEVEPLE